MSADSISTPELRRVSRAEAKALRDQAKAAGLTRFFTGTPCKHGHISERTTCNGGCVACQRVFWPRPPYWEWSSEKKSARRAYMTVYREENKEMLQAAFLRNKERHGNAWKDLEHAKFVKYYYKDIEASRLRMRVIQNRRRLLIETSAAHFTFADVLKLQRLQKWKCVNCLHSIKRAFHVDHIKPVSRGGDNSPNNIQLLCPSCNLRKRAKDPIAWAQEQGRLL